ncbi:MFS transporter [Nocardioides stalactiti]|uniref:MFS transporter n=1 Tax=Nocardioides stalactiti TaxID=2755356 RepID=UPI001FE24DF4|nr:MFS transporter [Nocardioides stalactiti]
MSSDNAHPLWRQRDYLCLTIGETVSTIGGAAASFALPLIVLAMTESAFAAGVVATAGMIGNLTALAFVGNLVDGHSRRAAMLVGQVTRWVTWSMLAILVTLGWFDVAALAALSLAGGAATALYRTAEAGALKTLVRQEQLPTAVAVIEGRGAAADLAGAPLGALLLSLALPLPLWINAASFAVAIIGIALIRTPLARPDAARPEVYRKALSAGFRYLRGQRAFLAIVISHGLVNFGLNAFTFAMIVILQRDDHPYWLISLYPAAAGIGLLAGSLLAPHLVARMTIGRLASTSVCLTVATMTAINLAIDHPPLILAAVVVGSLSAPASNAATVSDLAVVTPAHLQGRVFAADELATGIAVPWGILLAGLMVENAGSSPTLASLTAVVAVAAGVLLSSADVRSLPRLAEVEQA